MADEGSLWSASQNWCHSVVCCCRIGYRYMTERVYGPNWIDPSSPIIPIWRQSVGSIASSALLSCAKLISVFFCWDGTMQSVDVGWLSQQVGTETGSIGRQILAATRCRQKWEESEGLLKRETAETVRNVWGRLEFLFFFYQRQQTFQPFLERTTMNIHLPVVKALAAELDWLIDVRE